MNPASRLLTRARAAGFPVIGVSMRDPADWTTWIIQRDPHVAPLTPTGEQAMTEWLKAYDVLAEAQAWVDEQTDRGFADDPVLRAVVVWVAQRLNVPAAQAQAEIRALVRREHR